MTDIVTLKGLVDNYSPTGAESPAVDWLVRRMRELGFTRSAADEAGNAVGEMGAGDRCLVLLGHIDTVPGLIPVREENGILHGRGSVDAKGPLAAFVDAVAAAGVRPGWRIVVIGAVEEEGESRGAWHAAEHYRPQYALIGEPSGWDRLTLGYKGVARFEYSVDLEAGHTAAGGESACETAVAFWNRFVGLCNAANEGAARAFDRILPTLRTMHSESDGFRDRAVLGGNVRLPLGAGADRVEEILRQAAGSGPGTAVVGGVPLAAYRAEKNTPLVAAMLAGIRAEGGSPSFSVKLGTSDLCVVGPAWNCPLAVYGPGDSSLDHTPVERISVEEFGRAVRVLTSAIVRLTSG